MNSQPQTATAEEFDRLRPYLLRVAYSHLGSVSEAEDVVQDAWLRLTGARGEVIRDLRAWLTTVVSRLAVDALTSARARREQYVGPWLPEPLVEHSPIDGDPAVRTEMDESVSMALLVVLESLSPAERSSFLLHDVFGYPFDEVSEIVGRTPAATRQLASRARRAVADRRPRKPAHIDEQRKVVTAFAEAVEGGDLVSLMKLLDPAVCFRSDGGGTVNAARRPFGGAARVAQIFTALARHFGDRLLTAPLLVNGDPGLCLKTGNSPGIVAFTLDDGLITEINVVRNPDKLRRAVFTARGLSAERP
ncbi:MAG TPA: RNA polymerase sigma factor SigJ [Solirubrobacteraceae bacterium]|jgi:RNA polymerase sigma-70 factor (ECF subfamily)|nr:RNA polymerase sigma factor SigJ [Solirubrobacteraceae bacterium]